MPDHFDKKPVQVERLSDGKYYVRTVDEHTGVVTYGDEGFDSQQEAAQSVGGDVHAPVPANVEAPPPVEQSTLDAGTPPQPSTPKGEPGVGSTPEAAPTEGDAKTATKAAPKQPKE